MPLTFYNPTDRQQAREWDALVISARRLDRLLASDEPSIVAKTTSQLRAQIAELSPALRARLPELAATHAALRSFLARETIPQAKSLSPASIRARSTPAGDPRFATFGQAAIERLPNGDAIVGKAVIKADHFSIMEAERDETLATYEQAKANPLLARFHPKTLAELRTFILLGNDQATRLAAVDDRSHLAKKKLEIGPLLAQLKAQGKRFVLYFEGHDAAGKGSTSSTILGSLKLAGYEAKIVSFKGPTADERKQHWLQRFEKTLDDNPGVLVWDRGPAGNWAYGNPDAAALTEWSDFERKLATDPDTVFMKFQLRAEPDRQAATFGRRWARVIIAQELLAQMPNATPEERAGLQAVVETTLSPNDLPAFSNFEEIDSKFQSFVERSNGVVPWTTIDTSSRTASKTKALEAFTETLSRYSK